MRHKPFSRDEQNFDTAMSLLNLTSPPNIKSSKLNKLAMQVTSMECNKHLTYNTQKAPKYVQLNFQIKVIYGMTIEKDSPCTR